MSRLLHDELASRYKNCSFQLSSQSPEDLVLLEAFRAPVEG